MACCVRSTTATRRSCFLSLYHFLFNWQMDHQNIPALSTQTPTPANVGVELHREFTELSPACLCVIETVCRRQTNNFNKCETSLLRFSSYTPKFRVFNPWLSFPLPPPTPPLCVCANTFHLMTPLWGHSLCGTLTSSCEHFDYRNGTEQSRQSEWETDNMSVARQFVRAAVVRVYEKHRGRGGGGGGSSCINMIVLSAVACRASGGHTFALIGSVYLCYKLVRY